MEVFELYSFFLCLIVYVLMVLVFSLIIGSIYHMNIKLIRHGIEDERIIRELNKKRKLRTVGDIFSTVFSIAFCLVFVCVFAFSIYVQSVDAAPSADIPVLQVVKSDSMSYKDESNEYLFKNDINDQFDTFDIILTYKLPKEEDLKLYDIVVYEFKGDYIVHRIVGIEEPNEKHPDCRHFLLQGDAVKSPDYFPVTYDQMKAIYAGEKIPFVGSIVSFFQSPAGVLCIILIIFYAFITPLLNIKLEQEQIARYRLYYSGDNTFEVKYDESVNKPKNIPVNKGLSMAEKKKTKGLSAGKKISIVIIVFIVVILSYSISNVSASWNYAQGKADEVISKNNVITNWPIMSSKAETLADNIINHSSNGLNNPNSYLNDQIKSRKNASILIGGARDTLGSMAVNQGSELDKDFSLSQNGVDFLLHFCKDENGNDFYYLFITEVDLGQRGEINWLGNNSKPGNPTTPIGEYIHPIFRFKITKDANGKWITGPEEVGSALSAWYEESRRNEHATQIPSFDPDTWVLGNMTE